MSTNPQSKPQLLAETLSVVFLALVVAAANGLGLFYILFPELGALASDVLLRPAGKWARVPWKLIATPTLTAVLGVFVGTFLPYGVVSILLTMVLSIGVVWALRSAVSPAISAGILPIVLGVQSWLYPVCILGTLTVLVAILLVWRRTPLGKSLMPAKGPDEVAIEILESPPGGRWWFAALFLFVAIVGLIAQMTSWRFILFPPLVVMAYEMLGHTKTCPWAKAPFTFPLVCSLAALIGVEARLTLGVTPLAAIVSMVTAYLLLRIFRLRMPPALAIGLIPLVIATPGLRYALSVGVGTSALTAWFLLYRWLEAGPIASPAAEPRGLP